MRIQDNPALPSQSLFQNINIFFLCDFDFNVFQHLGNSAMNP